LALQRLEDRRILGEYQLLARDLAGLAARPRQDSPGGRCWLPTWSDRAGSVLTVLLDLPRQRLFGIIVDNRAPVNGDRSTAPPLAAFERPPATRPRFGPADGQVISGSGRAARSEAATS
jgi:hypothetical protein